MGVVAWGAEQRLGKAGVRSMSNLGMGFSAVAGKAEGSLVFSRTGRNGVLNIGVSAVVPYGVEASSLSSSELGRSFTAGAGLLTGVSFFVCTVLLKTLCSCRIRFPSSNESSL